MGAKLSVIVTGLKLLTFQGILARSDELILATVEADLLKISSTGAVTRWINLARYGVPTGITQDKTTIVVALSAQEIGHFLVEVSPQGKAMILADLSKLVGDFGAPFAIAVRAGYYPSYAVAISTDVTSSRGLVAIVTRSGQSRVLKPLNSSPFGIVAESKAESNTVVVTQENGEIVQISMAGESQVIADLVKAGLGSPSGIVSIQPPFTPPAGWIISTNLGWLVTVDAAGHALPLVNCAEAGFGLPTTMTWFDQHLMVATTAGCLLRLETAA
jgi:hypothetical protein